MTHFPTRNLLHSFLVVILSGACLCACSSALAQASSTASRGNGIAVYGGYTYEFPGQGSQNDTGVTAGLNLTAYVAHGLATSLEARGTYADGTVVRERTAVFGPRVTYSNGRIHPYADILIGGGTILYYGNTPRYQDRSTVFSFGGGMNYDLGHRTQIFGDAQGSHWQLGTTHKLAFEPVLVTVGLRYRLPFRPLIRHYDPDR